MKKSKQPWIGTIPLFIGILAFAMGLLFVFFPDNVSPTLALFAILGYANWINYRFIYFICFVSKYPNTEKKKRPNIRFEH